MTETSAPAATPSNLISPSDRKSPPRAKAVNFSSEVIVTEIVQKKFEQYEAPLRVIRPPPKQRKEAPTDSSRLQHKMADAPIFVSPVEEEWVTIPTTKAKAGKKKKKKAKAKDVEGPAAVAEGGGVDRVTVTLDLHNHIRSVIGSKGAVIQAIQESSGANVNINKDSPAHTCTIKGTAEEVASAETQIRSIMNPASSQPAAAASKNAARPSESAAPSNAEQTAAAQSKAAKAAASAVQSIPTVVNTSVPKDAQQQRHASASREKEPSSSKGKPPNKEPSKGPNKTPAQGPNTGPNKGPNNATAESKDSARDRIKAELSASGKKVAASGMVAVDLASLVMPTIVAGPKSVPVPAHASRHPSGPGSVLASSKLDSTTQPSTVSGAPLADLGALKSEALKAVAAWQLAVQQVQATLTSVETEPSVSARSPGLRLRLQAVSPRLKAEVDALVGELVDIKSSVDKASAEVDRIRASKKAEAKNTAPKSGNKNRGRNKKGSGPKPDREPPLSGADTSARSLIQVTEIAGAQALVQPIGTNRRNNKKGPKAGPKVSAAGVTVPSTTPSSGGADASTGTKPATSASVDSAKKRQQNKKPQQPKPVDTPAAPVTSTPATDSNPKPQRTKRVRERKKAATEASKAPE